MKKNIKKIIILCFRVLGCAGILMLSSMIFKNTIYIDKSYFGMWCLFTSIVMLILNYTVKPFLFWLTIPITGITLGLFYPFINLIILKLVSLILGDHFKIYGIWFAVFAAFLISVMNLILDHILSKIEKSETND